MKHLKKFLKNLWQDESGQGAIEYVLLAVVIVAIVLTFKTKIISVLGEYIDNGVSDQLKSALVP